MTITTIKAAPYFKTCRQKNCSQVIGLFKHYAANIKTYRFKNLTTGKLSIIHATPNHLFYVKNKHQFLPIREVSSQDQLIGKHDQIIRLFCNTHQSNHCGVNNKKNVTHARVVYNLEVYKQHHYKIGQDAIVVHNVCDAVKKSIQKRLETTQFKIIKSKSTASTKSMQTVKYLDKINTHSRFIVRYSKREWVMEELFKNPNSQYYASDVIYDQASKLFGEDITKPDVIVHDSIDNDQTLAFIKDKVRTLTEAEAEYFMKKTPNGKMIQHTLDIFEWKVKEVSIKYDLTNQFIHAFVFLQ